MKLTKPFYFLFYFLLTSSCTSLDYNNDILVVNPSIDTFESSNTNITSCTIDFIIKDNGGAEITEVGVCWSDEMEPTIKSNHKKCEINNKHSYNTTIDKLSAGKSYKVRAYAKNKNGCGYSSSTTINTLDGETAITTNNVSKIQTSTASFNGNVLDIANFTATEKGFCWSTSQNPTKNDNFITTTSTNNIINSNITGLIASTTYYVKAYVSNSTEIVYGNEVSFKTLNTSYTLQPGPTDSKCAYIRSLWPTDNAGGSGFQALAWTVSGSPNTARSLIDFDFSSIPEGTRITSAYLSLYNDPNPLGNNSGKHSEASVYPATGGDNVAYLKRITSTWEASTVSWNEQPTITETNRVYIHPSTDAHEDYLDINVTALIQDIINNKASSFGFMIMLETEAYYRLLIFGGSENADPTKRPKLVINI